PRQTVCRWRMSAKMTTILYFYTVLSHLASPFSTFRITACQSPGCGCRNNRAVGYQGLSSRAISQGQCGEKGSSTHTDLPIAPAQCAHEVSTVITRSSAATNSAVLPKSAPG